MEFIYRLFNSLYGENLHDYLAGYDCASKDYIYQSMFTPIGIIALIIAVVFFVMYYYIINSSKWNKWWHWIIIVLIVGVINFIVGYIWTSDELPEILKQECLSYYVDENNGSIDKSILMINEINFWMFGLANFFVSSIFFIILSFLGKWGSSACRRTPF